MTLRDRIAALALTLAIVGLGVAAPVIALAAEPAAAASDASEAQIRTLLAKTIADFQAGAPAYDNMAPDLAAAVKAQAAGMASLKQLGPAKTFERVGDATAPYAYKVTFENGYVLTWSIALGTDGKINYLLVN